MDWSPPPSIMGEHEKRRIRPSQISLPHYWGRGDSLFSKRNKAQHDKRVQLVERMLKLHQDKAARLATEKNMLQTQIKATDTQIDALVYALYGLTGDEIKVVEGAG